MVFVVLGIDGTQGVHLVPENVYRIGRRLGVEFYKDDEVNIFMYCDVSLQTFTNSIVNRTCPRLDWCYS